MSSLMSWTSPRYLTRADIQVSGQDAKIITLFAVVRFPPRDGFHPCRLVVTAAGRRLGAPPGDTSLVLRAIWPVGHHKVSVAVVGCEIGIPDDEVWFTVYPAL